MDIIALNFVLDSLRKICCEKKLNLVIVGSVAYKDNFSYEDCDDLDCVIIYDDIEKIESLNFVKYNLYIEALKALNDQKIDLFATKFKLNGIAISMDFISIEYFEKLSNSIPNGMSELLNKMTDAEEKPTNDYYNFYGEKHIYNKPKFCIQELNVYKLPKFLYYGSFLYPGVLYNKFLHAPKFEIIVNQEISQLHNQLIKNYSNCFIDIKKDNPRMDVFKSIRKWDEFSEESKQIIKEYFRIIE
ncbi:MAG: hypothetical protein PHS59_12100 [Paludibacter sp.]|nr:hypothetical protein [Paludibacter sp.]